MDLDDECVGRKASNKKMSKLLNLHVRRPEADFLNIQKLGYRDVGFEVKFDLIATKSAEA